MNKYHFRINNSVKHKNAGSKAVDDCRTLLLKKGYVNLEIYFNKSLILMPYNFCKLLFYLAKYLFTVEKKSLVFTQYPLLGINGIFPFYAKLLKLKGCRIACIIHDLEAIRSNNPELQTKKEIKALSAYDAVIAHNAAMNKWLVKNGFKGFITEITLFDYLSDFETKEKIISVDTDNLTLAFAGNLGTLGKSTFLKKLRTHKNSFFVNLYGSGYSEIAGADEKIKWQGSFSPDEIVSKLEGSFGLIWDGDNLEDITGLMGNYLKYNTPHKTSLYLVSGLPVIISKKAAMANFVRDNNIGICIDSLKSFSPTEKIVHTETYLQMKKNLQPIAEKLKRGFYFNTAVASIENYFSAGTA